MCKGGLSACNSMYHMCCLKKPEDSIRSPWKWSYKELLATMKVARI